MNNATQDTSRATRSLPHPRWLPVVAIILAIWAVALGAWWSRLRVTPAATQAAYLARATSVAAPTPQPGETIQPTPEGTPVTVPVVRSAGRLVVEEGWLALAQTFDTDRALADIAELTSAKYAGRAVGSPGGRLVGEWIAARFAEYGLQPAGDNSTYFQEFPVPYAELTAMPTFELVDSAGRTLEEYRLRYDYRIWLGSYADGGQAEGPVLWVSDGTHDDYDGLNAVGAIVLCRYRRPFDDIQRQALEHGAEAVLLANPEGANFRMRRTARSNALLPQGIPTLEVGPEIIEDLLAGSGMTLDDLTIEYRSRVLTTHVRIDLPLQYESNVTGRNVLGVLPGSDPDGMHQVFIIGGHYDHMGADPDGTAWVGANDDASGVAVLLEIARQWQDQGYVPRRTVLFAAWDGEEIGLSGSVYYVEHPRYPLADTVGMLQLDMVGAGTPTLAIYAGGLVGDQSAVSAAQLGIPVVPESSGGSDHVPFARAGVPASLYIWWSDEDSDLVYHVPEDDINNIEPDRLKAAGQLAQLVTLNMSWEHEELEDLGTQRQQAFAARDVDVLLQTVDPRDENLVRQQEEWLEDFILRQPAEFTVTVSSPIIAADAATSTTTIRYRWEPDDTQATVNLPERWIRRGLDWYYAGPSWDEFEGQHTLVQHLQNPEVAQSLAERADALYEFLTDEAGLDMPDTLTLRFYSKPRRTDDLSLPGTGSKDMLHAMHSPVPGYEEASGWPVDGGVVLSQAADLDTLLAEFALQHTGWPTGTTGWLAQGLLDYWEASDPQVADEMERDYMPLLLQADVDNALWAVEEMPSRYGLGYTERQLWDAQAWAVTSHLLQEDGWAALQSPATLDVEGWRSSLLDPWHLASEGIDDTLAERSRAALGGDKPAFLATVDPDNHVLHNEESHWFDDLESYPAAELAYESQLLALDDNQATVELIARYRLSEPGSTLNTVSYRARFLHRDGRWLYSGVDFAEQRSEHFVLKYEHPEHGLRAQTLLSWAEDAYAQVTEDLDFYPTEPIEIKIYHQRNLFSFSIYMSMIPVRGWTEPGESIKVALPVSENMVLDGIGATIAHELTHTALFSKGVQHGAVHEGTAHYEAGRYDPAWLHQKLRQWRREVYDLVRSMRPITLKDLADWREVAPDDRGLLYTVGWDSVTYFRHQYGRGAFLEWLRLLGTNASFEEAFLRATNTAFAEFDAAWRASVLRGHVDPQYIETASGFDGQRAVEEVRTLAQTAWAGREAGTPGNDAAVQYIAAKFAEYGLQPAGDEGTYLQRFDAHQTALITTPVLELFGEDSSDGHSLRCGVDFRQLVGGRAGSGHAESAIMYVKDPRAEDLRLGGRVMLTRANSNPWQDARDAQARGAGALLLMTNKWPNDMVIKTIDTPLLSAETIPVYELTKEASDLLLELAGYRPWQLEVVPPALPFPVSARVDVQLAVTPTVSIANVLGVLPGSDPRLSDEVLILGAHLDHVGRLPDGTIYPGANNNASGVAMLLEIARLWQEASYRPRRTVLFAAWNGTELGLLGSKHYVRNPVYALQKTIAMIQLDMVGQGRGFYIIVSGDERQDAGILAQLERAAPQVEGRLTFERYDGASDHHSFHQRGIPAVMLSWERPQQVHAPGDSVEIIDLQKLQTTGRVTALTLMAMADE
jgi:Zn-dependent M28 family amino/carboxypeptidase/uncharacterized protein YchJ